MLKARVEVCLGSKSDNFLEVRVIDVGIYAEETFEDGFDDAYEVLRERRPKLQRKNALIIELAFYPRHQMVDILRRITFDWLFNLYSIGPKIFVIGTGIHY